MKNLFKILITSSILFACGVEQKKDNKKIPAEKSLSKTTEIEDEDSTEALLDSITIYENRINEIPLPFPRKEMLEKLKKSFIQLGVTKEIGQQDGPDFPLYSLKNGETEICFFAMDWEDTLNLNKIYIKDALIKDEYGLKVGDSYQKIKKLRKGEIKTYTDYHLHTVAYFDNSNLSYEISGEASIPDTIDIKNLKLTEKQLKDWTIEYIIWRK
ncbi:DUF1131 family protein [Xanthovirga aplysinae]|uniref:DUF1131 family protein n=1 Tax=Xanthovirga aplysinae TaxID=2529853 RepID=UPI0012BD5B96|nr:DUF1131 family protein [Xanthovirga aplysinae]MTI30863.1 DUF1131 family protein [Xanthovirga aplysinae]